MDEYKVPKERAKVLLFIPPNPPQECAFYLSPNAENHRGREMVSDILRGTKTFFPILGEWDELILLRKETVRYIKVLEPETIEWLFYEERVGAPAFLIECIFTDDQRIEGRVYATGPEGERRVSDIVNNQEGFLPLEVEDGLYLVNLTHVERVKILENSHG